MLKMLLLVIIVGFAVCGYAISAQAQAEAYGSYYIFPES